MSASPCSKTSDLEEELKNVTNNLKSLEAQAEKVSVSCVQRVISYFKTFTLAFVLFIRDNVYNSGHL